MPHVCFFDIDIGYYAPVGLELSYQDTTISAFYVSGVQELGLGEEFLRIPIFFLIGRTTLQLRSVDRDISCVPQNGR